MKKYNYIYKTENLVNGKIYIGKHSTDKLEDGYLGSGLILKHAIKKYGKKNFKKIILEYCDTDEKLNDREIYWIKEEKSNINYGGYNLTEGGEGSRIAAETWALEAFASFCPDNRDIVFVADRGFGNQRWMHTIDRRGWFYVQRLARHFNVDVEAYIGTLCEMRFLFVFVHTHLRS